MRKSVKRLAWGGLLVGLAFLLILTWIYFLFPSKYVAEKIASRFHEKTGWRLTLESIRPLPLGTFEMGTVQLASPEGKPLFEVSSVRVNYKVLPLLRREIHLHGISIDSPRVYLKRSTGAWNYEEFLAPLPKTPEAPKEAEFPTIDYLHTPFPKIWGTLKTYIKDQARSLPEIQLDSLEIKAAHIELDDAQTGKVTLPQMDVHAVLSLTKTASNGEITISNSRASALSVALARPQVELKAEPHMKFQLKWPGEGVFHVQTSGKINELDARTATAAVKYQNVEAALESSLNLDAGNFDLSKAAMFVPGFLALEGHASIADFGKNKIAGALRLNLSPGAFHESIPEINAAADLGGKLFHDTLGKLLDAAAAKRVPAELKWNATMKSARLPVGFFGSPVGARELRVKASGGASGGTFEFRAVADGLGISWPQAIPSRLVDVHYDGAFDVTSLRRINIQKNALSIPQLGFMSSLQGTLESTVSFLDLQKELSTTKTPVRSVRQNLTGTLQMSAEVKNLKDLQLKDGISAAGEFVGRAKIQKSGADEVTLVLNAAGSKIRLAFGDLRARNVNFSLPLEKTLYLGAQKRRSGERTLPLREKLVVEGMNVLSANRGVFSADRIVSKAFQVEALSVDAGFDGESFLLDRMSGNALGGNFWARASLIPAEEGLRTRFAMEFVDVDASKLVGRKFEGDAKISADAQADLVMDPRTGLSTDRLLSEMGLRFHITKIGPDTLDRMLVVLDPKGEDPTFVQARGLLRKEFVAKALRNPEVSMEVSHGIFNADIRLPGLNFADVQIPIRGVSVKRLMEFAAFRDLISDLIPLLEQTKYLYAQGVDDAGRPFFALTEYPWIEAQRRK